MAYLADSIKFNSFHPGVKRMGFIIPWGVINKPLENKRLTPFITPSPQLSEASFFFQAVPHPVFPNFHAPINKQKARLDSTSSNDAGSPSGAGAPQPAICFSRQPGHYVQGGDVPVNKPVNLREGLTALPRPGVRESGPDRTTPCRHREASHE
ncbi:MAG: hypothetical protein MIO92_05100 [Methanosarcinaceae archaeon]|nr:hypothetical protein [Methanosarcinaceae archaeon]